MTEAAAMIDREVQHHLGEAAAWRLLGLLFERPREGWWQEVARLSREVADPELAAAADAAREGASEGLYLALLGPGGPVSLREVTYRGMEDPGRILADLQAFYQAFAFQPETEEAPDHLAVEAGFLGYLHLKAAYARARENDAEARVAAEAADRFRETHLTAFSWLVAERLEVAEGRSLSRAAALLARRSGARQDPQSAAKKRSRLCDDCHMKCGLE